MEKKEWHIVENAHEAIILKSDFEKVQARREQNKEKRERAMARSKATREKCYNHLSGMVYCGCCRRNMTFERRVHGTVSMVYLYDAQTMKIEFNCEDVIRRALEKYA